MLRTLLIVVLSLSITLVRGQGVLDYKLAGDEKDKSLRTIITGIENTTGARFYYLPSWLDAIVVDDNYKGWTLAGFLDEVFLGTDLGYFDMYPDAIVILKNPSQELKRRTALATASREQRKVEQQRIGIPGKANSRQLTLQGRVLDAKDGTPMPRTNIQVNNDLGTTTDDQGRYTITLAPGDHVLTFSFIDYETKVIDLGIYQEGTLDVSLEKSATLLDEIIIQDLAMKEVSTSRIGQAQISMKEIKRAPALLGEVDLVKQIQVLPGVATVSEAATGFNVRGGSVDQNLILYDGMPVFNSSHVFGFLSAFNPEGVRDVNFYRGGIPAEYGGRISSVLDIRSKDGSYEKWNGNAGIGMITSNLMVNGPLKKDKTAMAVSVRSTYSDWLVHSIRTDYANLTRSKVFFYDGSLKITHLVSAKTKLSFTGYSSKDAFRLVGDSTYHWNNIIGAARLDHQFNGNISGELVAGVSNYGYKVVNDFPETASKLSYRINVTTLKAGMHYQDGIHKASAGWQFSHYHFNPGRLTPLNDMSNARPVSLRNQFSVESAFYGSDEWTVNDRLFVEGGLRVPVFVSFGKAEVFTYRGDVPKDITTMTDTLAFNTLETTKAYWGVEPRVSFRWMAGPLSSVKFGYNSMSQFIHLVTNTAAVTPVDIWQPSGYYFRPQRAHQASLGYFKDFKDKKYAMSFEVFYKLINNLIDFKDGAQLILNPHLETDLLRGKGRAHGFETSLNKNSGKLTGAINYTYSRSLRLIKGPTLFESINRGQEYPSNFDQPHILNVTWKYNFTRRYLITANFTYHTGRPVTIPLSVFRFEDMGLAYFSGRNQYRIPDYHRLDLALVIEGNLKRRKVGEATWVFSVYNVYGRQNPYTIFFRAEGAGIPKPYQLSIVGAILPSVSYNYKF